MSFQNISTFISFLENNNKYIILKFTASWCAPCKNITPLINEKINELKGTDSDSFEYYELDVDEEAFDLYCKMKRLRITSGIPVLMTYYPDNCCINPDDISIGGDETKINSFFERVKNKIENNV